MLTHTHLVIDAAFTQAKGSSEPARRYQLARQIGLLQGIDKLNAENEKLTARYNELSRISEARW